VITNVRASSGAHLNNGKVNGMKESVLAIKERQRKFREDVKKINETGEFKVSAGDEVLTKFGKGIVKDVYHTRLSNSSYPIVEFDFYPIYPGGELSIKTLMLYPFDYMPV